MVNMTCKMPIILPMDGELLKAPNGEPHPLVTNGTMKLAVWKITGDNSSREVFLKMLPNSSSMPSARVQEMLTKDPGKSGIAGVSERKLIPFQHL